MKITKTPTIGETKTIIFSVLTMAFLYIIASCRGLVAVASGAILFTICFWFYPDWLRSRSGSLIPAFCLTAFVWLCAAVVIVMSLVGAVKL